MRCAYILTFLASSSTFLTSASPIPVPGTASLEGRALAQDRAERDGLLMMLPLVKRNGGDAYTGAAGSATGGDTSTANGDEFGLGGVKAGDIDSDNAGDGGRAVSGTAVGGSITQPGANAGNAYSGVGGNTNGGNADIVNTDSNYHRGYGLFRRIGHGFGYNERDLAGLGNGLGLLNGLELTNLDSGNAGSGGDSSSGDALGGVASGI